jgi:dihydroorotate dehydrogenase (fumarate)
MSNLLKVTIAGQIFEHPIMNGAGSCKDWKHIEQLIASASAAIVLGSVTKEARDGNTGEVYYGRLGQSFAINSLGMPNRGINYYDEHLPEMYDRCADNNKVLIVSVAGFTPVEYAEITKRSWQAGVEVIELNLGCPNVWSGGEQKPIASFQSALIKDILDRVEEDLGSLDSVLVKLSPYSDPALLEAVAEVLADRGLGGVVTSNTFPNATAFNEKGKPAIDNELGGLSGSPMLKIGQGQVKQFRKLLPEIDIIGVGGINSGQDVVDYLKAGATAVQITTAFVNEGPNVFSRILQEYLDLIGDDEV